MNALYTRMETWRPYILSILRIVIGLLFLEHGLSKVFGFPAPSPVASLSGLLILAAFLETVGAFLFLIGALHPDRGVHSFRQNGLRVFHGACAARVLPPRQWRTIGDRVLLHISLFCLCGRRPVER
jgi:hypothetical protein